MALPVIALGAKVGGALLEANQQAKALSAQSAAAAKTLFEAYRAGTQQERDVSGQASEQLSDRMLQAQRQLSMARVIAAEGGGDLGARVMSITAGAATDASRIEASRQAAITGIRDNMNAGRVQTDNVQESVKRQGSAIQMRFLTQVAAAGADYLVGEAGKASERRITTNRTYDYDITSGSKVRLGGPK